MSSGISAPVGMPIRTPNTVSKEGGMSFGSFSIQSMNTTVLNQMYQNTANMWGSLTEFGLEMFDLAYKYTLYEGKKKTARRKAKQKAKATAETSPEVKESHDTERSKEEQRSNRPGRKTPLGSYQSRQDEEDVAMLGDTESIPAMYEDIHVGPPDPRPLEEEDYR